MSTKKGLIALTAAAVATVGSAGVVIAGDGGAPDNSAEVKRAIDARKPKNVILLVGDGTGASESTIGRYYLNGAKGPPMAYETLPFTGELLTWNFQYGPGPDYDPNYVPDSAPTATAWSTGKKTTDARLSQGPSTAETVPGSNEGYTTTFELMKARGKAIGNVATSEITDATPAGPSSHISRRAPQGPNDARTLCPTETKAAGGLGSIAEQQVDHLLDVNLGGGLARWEQPLDNASGNVVDYAKSKGYQYVTDAAGLGGVTSVRNKPLLGLFASGNMTTQFAPLIAGPTPGTGSPTTRCEENNRPANEPSLAAMTAKSIELLRQDRDGFFLQVESASIDKRDHASDLCGQIGETRQLDEAVRVALDFQKRNRDTLVVVTADHSHTSQIVGETSDTPGFYATVQTADEQPMRVSYGTGKTPGGQGHTGARIPVAAIGPQASNVLGVRDQTDLFHTLVGRYARLASPQSLDGAAALRVRRPRESAAVELAAIASLHHGNVPGDVIRRRVGQAVPHPLESAAIYEDEARMEVEEISSRTYEGYELSLRRHVLPSPPFRLAAMGPRIAPRAPVSRLRRSERSSGSSHPDR